MTFPHRRRPRRFESLERRRLLATDLAEIAGLVFDDASGDGFTAGEAVSGAEVRLFTDNGDGVFNPATDTRVRPGETVVTGSDGRYVFERLVAGNYFVQQPPQTVGGITLADDASPLISIDADDVNGQLRTIIDDFDETTQSVSDSTGDGQPVVSSVAAPTVIGGERDLLVNKTSVNGVITLSIDDPNLPDILTFDSLQTGEGDYRIQWDGMDGDAASIDDAGLSGVAFGGDDAIGLQLQVGADQAGAQAVVRLYSDDGDAATAGRFSTATLDVPATGGLVSSAEFLPFSAFTPVGGGVDLNQITAIELEVIGFPNLNGSAELVGTVAPTVFTADFENFESADLVVTKTIVGTSSPALGMNITYEVAVSNIGPDTATAIEVSDPLPSGLSFVGETSPTGDYDASTGIWTIDALAPGGSVTLTLVARVDVTTAITNTATVISSSAFDPVAANNSASIAFTPTAIDLELAKTVDDAAPTRGQEIEFTILVNNTGSADATGVVVEDRLPTGLTFVGADTSQGSYTSTTGLWNVGTIAAGGSANLRIRATVESNENLENVSEVFAADQTDPDSTPNNDNPDEDDQDFASIVPQTADLRIQKEISGPSPNVGENVTFTITLVNEGPSTAAVIEVLDVLPAGLTFVSGVPSQGDYAAATGRWSAGALAVSESATLTLTALVATPGTYTNSATITSADVFDPIPINNSASVSFTPPTLDLAIDKTIDQTVVDFGDAVAFEITVTNTSTTTTATGIEVIDVLPAGYVATGFSPATSDFSFASGLWRIDTLAPGASVSLTLNATVVSFDAIDNVATITNVNEFDTNAVNDTASATVRRATADLSLTKSVSDNEPNVGETVTFVVAVSNNGPDPAEGVTVLDLLPAGLSYQSDAPEIGSYDELTGIWTIGEIGAGTSRSLTITALATSAAMLVNTASVFSADTFDPDSTPGDLADEDDLASVAVTGQQVDLQLTKTVDDPAPRVGQEIMFTVTVRNDGVSTATGVEVRDVLPPGLELVGNLPSRGSFNTQTGVFSVGTLGPGESASLALTARVDGIIDVVNSAEVLAVDQPDADPSNDFAEAAIRVPRADLELSKTAREARPNVGQDAVFDIVVTNLGPDVATDIVIEDRLSSNLDLVSTSLTTGEFDELMATWTLPMLDVGQSATLTVNASVLGIGISANTAEIVAAGIDDPDSIPGNVDEDEDDQSTATVDPPVIDLAVSKAASDPRPSLDELVTFVVTATNQGLDDATGIVIEDQISDGLLIESVEDGVGVFNSATGQWSIETLAPDATATLEIVARNSQVGMSSNTAAVIAVDQFDSDANNDEASVDLETATADLMVTKTIDDPAPGVGQDITFTVEVRNLGPDPAADITVLDTPPAGVVFLGANPAGVDFSPLTGVWSIPSLAVGEVARVQLIARADEAGERVNVAEITAQSEFDPDRSNDRSEISFSPELVDLALSKTVDQPRPVAGDEVTFTLALTNDGPSDATSIEVTDLLPASATFIDSTSTRGGYGAVSGIWAIPALPAGQIATLSIVARIDDTRGDRNVAEVTAVDQPDSDSVPDDGMGDDFAFVDFETQVANLSLTKSVDRELANRGEPVLFTVTLSNAGPDAATEIVVLDSVPPGLVLLDAATAGGTYDSTSGRWTIDALPAGETATLRLEANLSGRDAVTNQAEVIAVRQFDPNSVPGNASAAEDDFATATVRPVLIDLEVSATVDNDEPFVGDEVLITITTINRGENAASGVITRVGLPANLLILQTTASQGSFDPLTGQFLIGDLGAGQSATLTFRVFIDERGTRTIPVQVIAADQFDEDSEVNNNLIGEDDQTELIIRAPRLLTKRLFFAR